MIILAKVFGTAGTLWQGGEGIVLSKSTVSPGVLVSACL